MFSVICRHGFVEFEILNGNGPIFSSFFVVRFPYIKENMKRRGAEYKNPNKQEFKVKRKLCIRILKSGVCQVEIYVL
jgi:hypothetical protein